MKCPFCGEIDNKVIDSRLSKDGNVIRRRRECLTCSRRFTTYEHIEEIPIMIVKKDDRREVFSREKLRAGLQRACEKRGISMHVIDEFIEDLERDLRETGEKEISSRVVGERGHGQTPRNRRCGPTSVLHRFTESSKMSMTLCRS